MYTCAHTSAQQLKSEEYAAPKHPFRILSVLSITYPTSLSKMVSLRLRPTHPYPLNLSPQLHHSLACLRVFSSKMGMEMLLRTLVTFLRTESLQGRSFPSLRPPCETMKGKALWEAKGKTSPLVPALFLGTLKFTQNVRGSP